MAGREKSGLTIYLNADELAWIENQMDAYSTEPHEGFLDEKDRRVHAGYLSLDDKLFRAEQRRIKNDDSSGT